MEPKDLNRRLVYLDKAFIADRYELLKGLNAETVITSNQGGKAGARLPIFSAEISAQETRSFKVSTAKMLSELWEELRAEPSLDVEQLVEGMPSMYGWVHGELTVFATRTTSGVSKETIASSEHFRLRMKKPEGVDFALITTSEYFSSGLGALVKMQETLLKVMSIPVVAYVRVLAASDHMKQWIAVPLAMIEGDRPT